MKTRKWILMAGVALMVFGMLLITSAVLAPAPVQARPLNQVMQLVALNVKNYIRTWALYANGGTFLNGGLTMDTNKFLVANDTGNTSIAGTLVVTGNATFNGVIVRNSASITPTNGGTLTPTADIVTLTPAGALGTDMGACTTGSSTMLYNSVNANVVITDTGNGVLAGNQTLGQYDTLRLVCIDSKWVQIGAVSAN
jgi:hypothetical protein